MKSINIIMGMLFLASSSFGQTQGELNKEAGDKYKSADSTLNVVYQRILNDYSNDTAFISNLKISQLLWIQFRDAELKMKYPDSYSYGSVQPMCIYFYLADLINGRIKTLQVWLEGMEEGNVCGGSVKLKK